MKSIITGLLMLAALTTSAAAQQRDTLSLSLENAVDRALQVGDEVRLANAQVDVSDAQMTSARATALPQLRLTGSYVHTLQSARGQAVGSIFNQANTYTTNGNLSQAIFQGGRAIAGIRAASRLRHAARLTVQETRNNTAYDVESAYLNALFAQQMVDIQDANLKLADAQLKQVTDFEQAGRAARYDVLRARVERANIEPQLIQARNNYDVALLDLKRLTNIPAAQPIQLTTHLDGPSLQPLVTQASDQNASIESRPSVAAARLTAEARHMGITVARADLLPSINVFFQSGYSAFPTLNRFPTQAGQVVVIECPPNSTPGRVCTSQNGGWFSDRSLGVQVSWPIFDGLRVKGNIDAAIASARIADLQLQQEREAVALEIESARRNLDRARSLYNAQQQNASEANEAFRLASLRFTRGLSTQLEVSDAQLALMTARTNEARSVYDLYLALADLARAQGKPIPLPGGGAIGTGKSSGPDEK